jgi:protoporphyrinogen oxidase
LIAILGAGLAGLSTAFYLEMAGKKSYTIFEKNDRVGGTCRSEKVDGFTFDYTGHFLHFATPEVKQLVLDLMKKNIHSLERDSWIYSKNVLTPYPFQQNTYGLPPKVIKECVLGLIEAKYANTPNGVNPLPPTGNFKEWIDRTFGRGIAKHFMVPYNEKLWTVPVGEMTCDWMGRFIPQPSLEDVLDGALTGKRKKMGYNAVLWYPLKGGIESLPAAFLPHVSKPKLNSEAIKIDLKRKAIILKDDRRVHYEWLVSTMPLNQLMKIASPIPREVREATRRLRHNSVLNINFGIQGRNVSERHWIYFPERKFSFYRVGFPHNFSPHQAPRGSSSVNVEISYTRENPVSVKEAVRQSREDLIKSKILHKADKIVVEKCLQIPCAYVIYDHDRAGGLQVIQKFLDENAIFSVGRYGAWEYSSMEDAILHGKRTADALLAQIDDSAHAELENGSGSKLE